MLGHLSGCYLCYALVGGDVAAGPRSRWVTVTRSYVSEVAEIEMHRNVSEFVRKNLHLVSGPRLKTTQ